MLDKSDSYGSFAKLRYRTMNQMPNDEEHKQNEHVYNFNNGRDVNLPAIVVPPPLECFVCDEDVRLGTRRRHAMACRHVMCTECVAQWARVGRPPRVVPDPDDETLRIMQCPQCTAPFAVDPGVFRQPLPQPEQQEAPPLPPAAIQQVYNPQVVVPAAQPNLGAIGDPLDDMPVPVPQQLHAVGQANNQQPGYVPHGEEQLNGRVPIVRASAGLLRIVGDDEPPTLNNVINPDRRRIQLRGDDIQFYEVPRVIVCGVDYRECPEFGLLPPKFGIYRTPYMLQVPLYMSVVNAVKDFRIGLEKSPKTYQLLVAHTRQVLMNLDIESGVSNLHLLYVPVVVHNWQAPIVATRAALLNTSWKSYLFWILSNPKKSAVLGFGAYLGVLGLRTYAKWKWQKRNGSVQQIDARQE